MLRKFGEKSTRSEILRFIKLQGRAAVQEISRALLLTPMAVRRHVHRLQRAGLVHTVREHRRRGRPADLCLLTDIGDGVFPKAYDRFSADLIRTVAALDGEAKVDRLFEKRRENMVARFAGRLEGKGREARVREIIAILCEEGYMAELRKLNARKFLVTEHNCAIAHIARDYPQVCQSELCFLAQILGAEVHRQAHILKGDAACSYLIQFPTQSKSAAATKH